MKANFNWIALYLSGFLLVLTTTQIKAQFQRIYGNGQNNYFHKVVPDDYAPNPGYYVIGSEDNHGTISHVFKSGQLDWTIKLNKPCVLSDAAPVFNGFTNPSNLMVVGFTLPFDQTNRSLLIIVTPTGGLKFSEEYDLAMNEGFVSITPRPVGNFAISGFINSPNFSNNVVLLDVNANGATNMLNVYGNLGDNGYFRDIEVTGPTQYFVAGYDGNAGVIISTDNLVPNPNFLGGVRDPSVQTFVDIALQGNNVIAAGPSVAPGATPLLRKFDANLFPVWTVKVNGLDTIHQVETSSVNGDIYLVGTKNIAGIDRAVVVRIDDANGAPPSSWTVWSKYLDSGENSHVTGQITILDNPTVEIAFADGKAGIFNSFGQGDAFMALTDENLSSLCTKDHLVTFSIDTSFFEGPQFDHVDFTSLNPVGAIDYNPIQWSTRGPCPGPAPIANCGDIKVFVEPGYKERRVGFEWDVAQTDLVALEYSPASGSMFPLGTTPVVARATYANGDTSSCRFNVIVEKLPEDSLQAPPSVTPGALFDRVYDQYGNPYRLADLQVQESGRSRSSCPNSYFDLYFEPTSGMFGSSAIELARRDVICQVFSDISQFIPQPNPNNPARVNIFVRNLAFVPSVPNPATSNVLGVAGAYYAMPPGVGSKGGLLDNEIWKTINSGIDSYTGLVSPLTTQNNGGFYHGFLAFNFANSTIDWHTDMANPTAANLYDLYTVALHEVLHALGFASLIVPSNNSGTSFFAPANANYFNRYDAFLKSPANLGSLPLITNPGACSSMYDYDFNPNLVNTGVLNPDPSNPYPDQTLCTHAIQFSSSSVNQSVFTPNAFSNGSSLSHFEDQCKVPVVQPNNEYYVMSNATDKGATFMKRYPKPEEREVLCQLGYQVLGQYGNQAQHSFYDYQSAACNTVTVAGVNDGIGPNGTYLYTAITTGAGLVINPLVNDQGAVSFECLESLLGTGNPSNTSGTSFTFNPGATPGINLLRYVPVGANGKKGNITYIFVYVDRANCPMDSCNLVSNGGFESSTGCGGWYPQNLSANAPAIDCWEPLAASPDLFTRTCTSISTQVGVSTYNSIPPTDSYNGVPNDKFLGLYRSPSFPQAISEAAQTRLTTPLQPGKTYELSFWAKTNNNINGPSSNIPARVEFASEVSYPLIHVMNYLPGVSFQPLFPNVSVPNDTQWHYFSQTFTFNGLVPHSNLIVAYGALNFPPGVSGTYFFIDDIKLKELGCQDCACGTYSDMSYRPYQGAQNISVDCGDTLVAQCNGPIPWTFGGKFLCQGNACDTAQMFWILTKPNGTVKTVPMLANPFFNFAIPATEFNASGSYNLSLKGICGQDTCYCNFVIEVKCDSCCSDLNVFCQAIEEALNLIVDTCKATLSIGTLRCNGYIESVDWGDGDQSIGHFGSGSTLMHVYATSGTYYISYVAIGQDEQGIDCIEKILYDTIVACNRMPTSNKALKAGESFHIFPNPTSGKLTLQTKGILLKEAQLQILDLWGRTIYTEKLSAGQPNYEFSIPYLASGLYFVKVLNRGELLWIHKIIKQ